MFTPSSPEFCPLKSARASALPASKATKLSCSPKTGSGPASPTATPSSNPETSSTSASPTSWREPLAAPPSSRIPARRVLSWPWTTPPAMFLPWLAAATTPCPSSTAPHSPSARRAQASNPTSTPLPLKTEPNLTTSSSMAPFISAATHRTTTRTTTRVQ